MNYQKLYYSIIEKRKESIPSGYTEIHHIIPRCLGGTDDKDNLVKLSAKEHFMCHLLLTKMYEYGTIEYYKMCNAFLMMLVTSKDHQNNRYITSRKYEKLKVSFSERMSTLQSGKNNSQHGTMWIYNKELQQCKKVPKDSELESGWYKGRVLNWNKQIKIKPPKLKKEKLLFENICDICGNIFSTIDKNRIICSVLCTQKNASKKASIKNTKKVIDDNGIVYNSMKEAGEKLNVTPECIYYRIQRGIYKYAKVDQRLESNALEALCCGFESHLSHQKVSIMKRYRGLVNG